jgi:hypothetical protein
MFRTCKPNSASRPRLVEWAILVAFGLYALVRTIHSVTMLFPKSGWDGHDLKLIYETWLQFISPHHAAAAFVTITYLPYVWWLLTPIFIFGWPGAKIVWCIANFGFAGFCCHRLGKLLNFGRLQFWLCLTFFFSWVSTGLVIGLGNVALATLTAVIAWLPGETRARSFYLLPAALKHSLTFPLFLNELIRRPRRTFVPCVILAAMIIASMAWAHTGVAQLLKGMKAGEQISSEVWMKENPTVSLLPAFQAALGQTRTAQILNWAVWFALAAAFVLLVSNRISLVAGLLLLGLLPIHHRPYDMLVAFPAMALFLARDWRLAALVTVLLSGVFDTIQHGFGARLPLLNVIGAGYYQVVILAMLSGLVWLERVTARPCRESPQNAPSPP